MLAVGIEEQHAELPGRGEMMDITRMQHSALYVSDGRER